MHTVGSDTSDASSLTRLLASILTLPRPACDDPWGDAYSIVPVADDTVHCAMNSVAQYVPDIGGLGEKLTFSFDRMLISVNHSSGVIRQRRAATLDLGSSPLVWIDPTKELSPPKYADPYMQLERFE